MLGPFVFQSVVVSTLKYKRSNMSFHGRMERCEVHFPFMHSFTLRMRLEEKIDRKLKRKTVSFDYFEVGMSSLLAVSSLWVKHDNFLCSYLENY